MRIALTRRLVVNVTMALLLALVVSSAGLDYLAGHRRATYTAELTDAGGLHTGDDVKVAGIVVGTVEDLSIHGPAVRVEFSLPRDVHLGRTSVVEVKLANLFGKRYLAVAPSGPGRLESGSTLPTSSEPPFTIQDLVTAAGTQLPKLDAAKLQQSIGVLVDAFRDTPASGEAALTGIARLSTAISRRGKALDQLLTESAQVTNVLADQRNNLVDLMDHASKILEIVRQRRATIHSLLQEIDLLGARVTTLVRSNQGELATLLADTSAVTAVLRRHDKQLHDVARLFAPVSRYLANASGNGPWLQTWAPYMLFPDSINCTIERKCSR